MKKALKIIIRTICGLIIFVILLPIVVNILLQIGPIQNFAVRKVTEVLSNMTGTHVSVKHVDLEFFSRAKLSGIFFADNRNDTLIYAEDLSVDILNLNFLGKTFNLGDIIVNDLQVNLYRDSLGVVNIADVFEHFRNPDADVIVDITAHTLSIPNAKFTFRDFYAPRDTITNGAINFRDLSIKDIELSAQNIAFLKDNVWLDNLSLSFMEDAGRLDLQALGIGRAGVDSSGLVLRKIDIITPYTEVALEKLTFHTDNKRWIDWRSFKDSVTIDCHFNKSYIATKTLANILGFSLPKYEDIEVQSAEVLGHVNDFSVQLKRVGYGGVTFGVALDVKGLPDIKNTHLGLEITPFSTSGKDILKDLNTITYDTLAQGTAQILENLENIDLSLNIKGSIDSLVGNINLQSSRVGALNSRFFVHNIFGDGRTRINGNLDAKDFMLGDLLDSRTIGSTTLAGNYTVAYGGGITPLYGSDIKISDLEWNKYNYNSILLKGLLEKAVFSGNFESLDSNFMVDISGSIDFNDKLPYYDFTGRLNHINLSELGMNSRDSIALFSATITASGTGLTLDDFNGSGTIDDILYINSKDTIRTSLVAITSIAEPNFKELELNSGFLDVKFRGTNSFEQIVEYVERSIGRFIPIIPSLEILSDYDGLDYIQTRSTTPIEEGYYQLNLNVKEANNVASAFVPSLEVAEGSSLNLVFNPSHDQFSLRISSEHISFEDLFIEELEVDSRNIGDSISFYSTASLLIAGGMELPSFSLLGGLSNSAMTLSGQYSDQSGRNSALFSTYTTFSRNKQGLPEMIVDISPTTIVADSVVWNISPAKITLDSTAIKVNQLALHSKDGRFEINGTAGKTQSDTLTLTLANAKLEPVSIFVQHLGYQINGSANGNINLISALDNMKMLARVKLDSAGVNGRIIGSPEVRSTIDNQKKRVNFTVGDYISDGSYLTPIIGHFDINNKKLNIDFDFDSVPLSYLDPLVSGILSNNRGSAKADLTLTAQNGIVQLNGEVNVRDFSTVVDFTQTQYWFEECCVEVKNSSFYLPQTRIKDSEAESGTIQAQIVTNSFQGLNYSVRADFKDLLALNTTLEDNSDFYGKAYGTGFVEVNGDEKNSIINIVGKTAKSSNIVMPFSGASTIKQAEFIRFVDPDKDSLELAQKNTPKTNYLNRFRARRAAQNAKANLQINLNIDVQTNLLAQLELDAKMGDVIRARGQGRLLMNINPDLDIFAMEGPIEITDGNYLFTLQTIINKRFVIEPGSQIIWTGDPTNPDINLTAIYKLKTSLTPLTGDVGTNTTANIDCGILLTDKLLSPTINFNITAPSADAEIQNALKNSLNTQEALSMQFLSLMLANSFMPDMQNTAIGTVGSNIVGVTGLEFLSNQLSNLISNDKISLRIGYKPLSETNSDEFTAGVGAQIISDVLMLEVDGNYNMGNNASLSNQENPFTVDAYLTWNINRSGTLKLKGFTRTIDRFDETQGMQENGAGVYFRQDFHNFKDLQRRLKDTFQRDSAEVAERKVRKLEKKQEKIRKREEDKKNKD